MNFSLLLINTRGLKSKEYSLRKLLRKKKPSMVAINETQLTGKESVNIKPYTWWSKNRDGKGGGGIATGVSQELKDFAVGVGEGQKDDEYLITRLESFSPALNVVNCYGEQRKTSIEEVEEKWKRMLKDMEEIRAKGEYCVLTGDLNKLVGNDELGVPGNHPEVSPGGRS